MRQLFANPDAFIDQCIAECVAPHFFLVWSQTCLTRGIFLLLHLFFSRAKRWGWTGYNVDFEPTVEATPDDGIAYAAFLDYARANCISHF